MRVEQLGGRKKGVSEGIKKQWVRILRKRKATGRVPVTLAQDYCRDLEGDVFEELWNGFVSNHDPATMAAAAAHVNGGRGRGSGAIVGGDTVSASAEAPSPSVAAALPFALPAAMLSARGIGSEADDRDMYPRLVAFLQEKKVGEGAGRAARVVPFPHRKGSGSVNPLLEFSGSISLDPSVLEYPSSRSLPTPLPVPLPASLPPPLPIPLRATHLQAYVACVKARDLLGSMTGGVGAAVHAVLQQLMGPESEDWGAAEMEVRGCVEECAGKCRPWCGVGLSCQERWRCHRFSLLAARVIPTFAAAR